MAELISRERARHEFALFFQDSKSLVDDCDSLICMLPTIDAVPVVRCKDCKHHRIMENKKSFMYWHNCELWCADINEDDFCSYGERKEGDG